MKRNRAGLFILLILFLTSHLWAQGSSVYEKPINLNFPASSALGGQHVAQASGFSTLFANPAGFYEAPQELSISEITAGLTGPVFTLGSVILEGLTAGDLSTLLADPGVVNLLSNIYAAASLSGPIYFGYLGNGLGFGIFNTTDVTIYNPRSLSLAAKIEESVILCGGYSLRIPLSLDHALDLGMLLKGMIRGELIVEKTLLELVDFDQFGIETLLSSPFSFISAIGFDAGLRYQYKDIFAVGISGKDLYTPLLRNRYDSLQSFLDNETPEEIDGIIPLTLNLGIMFSPPLEKLARYISGFKILLDYEDLLDFVLYPDIATHPLLHLGLGTEVVLLEILTLRGGFYQGLFAAGLGLDLSLFRLNMAMFGTERSSEVGMNSVYNLQIGFEFRL